MASQKIGKMSLKNQGAFVVKLRFSYRDENDEKQLSAETGNITLGFTKTADPGELGVPDDTDVSLYASVVWGNDNEARRAFHYEKGNPNTAHFLITGTTLNNEIGLIRVSKN
jgi:hypothetical protein